METKKLALLVGSLVVLLGAGILIWRALRTPAHPYNPSLDECLGGKLADAAAQLLGDYGEIVVVSYAGSSFDSPVSRARRRGFEQALERHPGLKVLGHVVPSGEEEMEAPGGIPKPLIERAMALYPEAKALVSFLGVPAMRGMFGDVTPEDVPAVAALSLGEVEQWRALIGSPIPAAIVRNRYFLETQATLPSDVCDDYLIVSNVGEEK